MKLKPKKLKRQNKRKLVISEYFDFYTDDPRCGPNKPRTCAVPVRASKVKYLNWPEHLLGPRFINIPFWGFHRHQYSCFFTLSMKYRNYNNLKKFKSSSITFKIHKHRSDCF